MSEGTVKKTHASFVNIYKFTINCGNPEEGYKTPNTQKNVILSKRPFQISNSLPHAGKPFGQPQDVLNIEHDLTFARINFKQLHNTSYMGVSKNRGTPKSSILIGFSMK